LKKKLLAVAALAAPLGIALSAGSAHADPTPNFIVGTNGVDLIVGTKLDDYILGLRGHDVINPWRGDDIVRGGGGPDTIRSYAPLGLSGHDIVRGGRGIDTCIVDAGDRVFGCEIVIRHA
jgi:Ca2+-binding RTX toxin-like protein